MSTHNICFAGEMKKILKLFEYEKTHLELWNVIVEK